MSITPSTFFLRVNLKGSEREAFMDWSWLHLQGLMGVHEGTLLSEQAHRLGFETEAWVLDPGRAPEKRDWIRDLDSGDCELYFATRESAQSALTQIQVEWKECRVSEVEEQAPRDWDAEWKASFKGVEVHPYWQVLPPWEKPLHPSLRVLRLTPGAGFGTGTHETTQLCLTAIGDWVNSVGSLKGRRVLDFGSGSGILAIAAALMGAEVDAVEIDPLAIENAKHNAELNQVLDRIRFGEVLLSSDRKYDLIIANILKPVLLEFAPSLVERLNHPPSGIVLSGLVEKDVAEVRAAFEVRLEGGSLTHRTGVLGEWRSLYWTAH